MPPRLTSGMHRLDFRLAIVPPLGPKVAPFPARVSVETANMGPLDIGHLEGDVTTLLLLGEEVHHHLSLVGDAPIGGELVHPIVRPSLGRTG